VVSNPGTFDSKLPNKNAKKITKETKVPSLAKFVSELIFSSQMRILRVEPFSMPFQTMP